MLSLKISFDFVIVEIYQDVIQMVWIIQKTTYHLSQAISSTQVIQIQALSCYYTSEANFAKVNK